MQPPQAPAGVVTTLGTEEPSCSEFRLSPAAMPLNCGPTSPQRPLGLTNALQVVLLTTLLCPPTACPELSQNTGVGPRAHVEGGPH